MLGAVLAHSTVWPAAVSDLRVAQLPLDSLPDSCNKYESLDELLDDRRVDVVYIATPTPCHFDDVRRVLASGRSAIVEKPFTSDLQSATELSEIALSSENFVIVGHSRSFEPDIRAAADIVRSGRIGTVECIAAAHYSSWLRRPRLPDELDAALGGGIINRQAVHQIDAIRTLLGGDKLRVTATHHRPDRDRDTIGSYIAWLESDTGASVSLLMDGVGTLVPGASDPRQRPADDASSRKREMSDAILAKAISGDRLTVQSGDREEFVVLGTLGEISIASGVLTVSDDSGTRSVDLSGMVDGRHAVLDELVACRAGEATLPRHDAAWGLENMKTCAALAQQNQS